MTPLLALSFELARPIWLLVLLTVPVFAWMTWRTARGRPRAGDLVALGARSLLLLVVALALSIPRVGVDASFRSVAYVLDTSESIPVEAIEQARDFVKRSAVARGEDDDAAFVVFADGAAVEAPFARISTAQRMEPVPIDPANVGSMLPRGETDIEGALRLARAGFPPGGARRIVLVTDGNETRGDAVAAVRDLVADGVDVQFFPLRYERDHEVYVEKLVAPASSPRNLPVPVRSVVWSTHDDVPARIRFLVEGVEVAARDEILKKGRNVYEVGPVFSGAGFHTIETQVDTALDGDPQNNRGLAATEVHGPGQVLVVTPNGTSALGDALIEELTDPVIVGGVDLLPSDPGGYAPYDVVVLQNTPAFAMSPLQRKVLSAAVRELGVGLVCVGGDKAYGPGGYAGTEIEKLLPLSSEIRQKRVLPSGALVVILHTCEFPGGNEAARRITKAALDALSAHDEIGVIQWGMSGDEWLIKLQQVGDKRQHYKAIQQGNPMDMPSYDSSLALAEKGLNASTAAAKHIIVISDGDATPPNLKLAAKMHDQRITISTVCVDPHDPSGPKSLRNLSAEAGGNHYDVKSSQISRLPQIFIKEAVTVRRSAWRDEAFQPTVLGTHTMLRGFGADDFPALRGYTVTTLKEKADPLMGAPHDDPLLAWWRHGLGETAAWASDAGDRWAIDWMAWGGYGRFWGQVVRSCARALERPGVRVETDLDGGSARVFMDVLREDGAFENGLSVRGVVIRPDGESEDFRVVQAGPGRYEGRFDADQVGTYLANLVYEDPRDGNEGKLQQVLAGVCVAYSAEHLAQGSDERFFALLEAAGATLLDPEPPPPPDGQLPIDTAQLPWTGELQSSEEPLDLWMILAGLAALLLVTDVALRRVRIKLPQRTKPAASAAPTPKPVTAAASIARPRPDGAYVPPTEVAPDDAPPTPADAPPTTTTRKPAPRDGLLGAKRRAQKKQDWEENQ